VDNCRWIFIQRKRPPLGGRFLIGGVAGIRPHGSPCKSSRRRRQLMCAGTSAEIPPSLPRVLFPQAAQKTKGCPKAARRFFGGGGGNRPCRARPRLHAWAALTAHDMKQFMSRVRSSPASRGFSSRKPHQKPRAARRQPLVLFGGGGGNRTRVRKPYTARTTCLARSFGSRLAPAGRQADAQPVASTDPRGQATKLRREAGVNDAAPLNPLGLRLACSSA